jgi:anti-anti-sigma regulatory factor
MAQKTPPSKPLDITLDVQLSLANARALKERLLYGLKQGSKVRLQGNLVERIDTACIQVLAAFFESAQQRKVPAAWLGVSQTLERALARVGLAKLLEAREKDKESQ